MPPIKKTKFKKKKKKKQKHKKPHKPSKCGGAGVTAEVKASETDWWEAFSAKMSSSGPKFSDEEEKFKHFFRVSKKTFEYICSLVREDLISRPPSGLINIEGRLLSVEKQVAIALRRLASGESQVSVGDAFGVGQSTVSQVTWRFIESMEERAKHHLQWPDAERIEMIKEGFEAAFGMPNCCGAIDATHIIMTLPAVETSEEWCDHERNYSMFLQVVVDDRMRFLDIVTGWPGSMATSQLLKFSGFYKLCQSGERLNGVPKILLNGVQIREYIVGSAAYPLLPWLITPYERESLSTAMVNFNSKHKPAMLLAQRGLAQLKCSWRILHKAMWRPDKHKLPSIILVCCLLHNIVMDTGDTLRPDVAISDHHDPGYKQQCCQEVDTLGQSIRNDLSRYL
ncbi:unnamed protein product [Victoria cruziana]